MFVIAIVLSRAVAGGRTVNRLVRPPINYPWSTLISANWPKSSEWRARGIYSASLYSSVVRRERKKKTYYVRKTNHGSYERDLIDPADSPESPPHYRFLCFEFYQFDKINEIVVSVWPHRFIQIYSKV